MQAAKFFVLTVWKKDDIPDEKLRGMLAPYAEGYIYYGKTQRHPNLTLQYTVRSNLDLFTFNAAHEMELIDRPLLIMAGSEADTLYMSEECFKNATLFLDKGTHHIQIYFVPE